jgi:FixJ family two-component response regulator
MSGVRETVIVIDDDLSVREAIEGLLQSVGFDVRVYGSVGDFLAAPFPDTVRCILSDVRMPGRSGLDLQEHLKRAAIAIPMVFMSAHGDVPMSVRALKNGAIDFLVKPVREQDLLDAVRKALDQDRKAREDHSQLQQLLNRTSKLTEREKKVFEMVCTGLINKEIAFRLGIKEITVKVHRAQVMSKLGAPNIAGLIRIHDRIVKADDSGLGRHSL